MIIDLYIMLFLIAFVLTLISVYEKSLVFSILSIIVWMIVFVQSFYVVVPYHTWIDVNDTINVTTGYHIFTEYGLNALCLAFIFFGIVWSIICAFDFRDEIEMP